MCKGADVCVGCAVGRLGTFLQHLRSFSCKNMLLYAREGLCFVCTLLEWPKGMSGCLFKSDSQWWMESADLMGQGGKNTSESFYIQLVYKIICLWGMNLFVGFIAFSTKCQICCVIGFWLQALIVLLVYFV